MIHRTNPEHDRDEETHRFTMPLSRTRGTLQRTEQTADVSLLGQALQDAATVLRILHAVATMPNHVLYGQTANRVSCPFGCQQRIFAAGEPVPEIEDEPGCPRAQSQRILARLT